MSKNLCEKCGAELSENVAKCPKCGAVAAASPADSDLFAEFLMSDESSDAKAKPSASDSGVAQASDSGVAWGTEGTPASAEEGIDLGPSQASDSGVKWTKEPSDSGTNWSTESGVGLAAPQEAAGSEEPIDTTAPEPAGTLEPAKPSESDKTQISRTPPIGAGHKDEEAAFFGQEGGEDAGVEFAEYEPGGADEQVVAPEGEEGEAVPEFTSDMADEVAADETGAAARPHSPALAALAAAGATGTAALAAPRKSSLLAIVGALLGGIVLGGGGGAGVVHFLMLQPKVAELNTAQNDKTKLNADINAVRADKASVDETIKQTETRLADVQKELSDAQTKATNEERKAAQANNEKVQLAKSRAAAEAERDVVKFEADGSAVLALNPELILAAELLPKPADLTASPDLVKLWSDYFVQAETLLGEAIKGNPNRARNYALRAWAYQARGGEPAEIEADLKKALELDAASPDPVVQFIAARIYEQMGKADEAAQYLAAAAKAAPAAGAGPGAVAPVPIAERRGEFLRHVALARAASERTGELADTLRLLDRALALEPKEAAPADRVALRMERASLLLRRGSQLQSAGQVEPAVQALEGAAESAAEAAEISQAANLNSAANALYAQGRALELLGKLDDALKAFEVGTPLARDDAEKSRFAAARSRVRTAKVARASANAPQSGVRGRPNDTEITASRASSRDDRSDGLGLPYEKLALLSALLTGVQDEAKPPTAPTAPTQEPANKVQPQDKPKSDQAKPDEPADKPGDESSKKQEPAKPKTPPAPPNPELEQALRDAEQAIKDSGGKSADAFYAKGLTLSAMKRFDPAIDAFLAGAAQITDSADVAPEHFIRAVADAYRQRTLTPQESKITQLEEQVTGLTETLQQKTTQLGDTSTKLESTTMTLDETSKQLAIRTEDLAKTRDDLAKEQDARRNERVVLQSEQNQHELWKGRYEGLMVATAEEKQRESAKLYAQGLNHFFSGKYAAAVETLSEAIRMHPRDARYRYFRGLAYYRQASLAQAENDLKEASALERQDAPRRRDVDKSLLRIQGKERLWLEAFRPEL